MAGDKINSAKEAVRELIDYLPSKDIINLVTYNNSCQIIFENESTENKKSILDKLNKVNANGGTNISYGLETSKKLLNKKKNKNILQKIFLFSDGLPNEGMVNDTELGELSKNISSTGIRISSFGIGDDFNESIMRAIADKSEGDYFYISSSENIKGYIAIAVDKTIHTICTNTNLKLRGKNCCVVKKFISHNSGDIINGLKIGDIVSYDKKSILIQINVSPSEEKDDVAILDYDLSFDLDNERQSIKGEFSLNFTKDDKKIENINKEILIECAIYKSVESNLKVSKLIDDGKSDEAKNLLKSIIKDLEVYEKDSKKIANIIGTLKGTLEKLSKTGNLEQFSKNIGYTTREVGMCMMNDHIDECKEMMSSSNSSSDKKTKSVFNLWGLFGKDE